MLSLKLWLRTPLERAHGLPRALTPFKLLSLPTRWPSPEESQLPETASPSPGLPSPKPTPTEMPCPATRLPTRSAPTTPSLTAVPGNTLLTQLLADTELLDLTSWLPATSTNLCTTSTV